MAEKGETPGFRLDKLSSGLTLNQVFQLDEQLSNAEPESGASLATPSTLFPNPTQAEGNQALRYERPKAPAQKAPAQGSRGLKSQKEENMESTKVVFQAKLANGRVCWIERDTPFAKFVILLGNSINNADLGVRVQSDFVYGLREGQENCVKFYCASDTVIVDSGAKFDGVKECQAFIRVLLGIQVYMGWQADPIVQDPTPKGKILAEGDVVGLSASLWKLSKLIEQFEDPGRHKAFETDPYVRLTLGSLSSEDLAGISASAVERVETLLQGRRKGSWCMSVVERDGEEFILQMTVVKVKHAKAKVTAPVGTVAGSDLAEMTPQVEEMQRKLDLLLQRSESGVNTGARHFMFSGLQAKGIGAVSTGGPTDAAQRKRESEEVKKRVKKAFTAAFRSIKIDKKKQYTGEEMQAIIGHLFITTLKTLSPSK